MSERLLWSETRESLIRVFGGQLPSPVQEEKLIPVFEQRPTALLRASEQIGERFAQGKIRRPWSILVSDLAGALEPLREAEAEGGDRELLVRCAESWIRNAGLYVGEQKELEDALFGDCPGGFGGRGQSLRAWRTDEALRGRMVRLWMERRRVGRALEQEASERAAEHRQARARARELVQAVPLAPRPERATANERYFEPDEQEEGADGADDE